MSKVPALFLLMAAALAACESPQDKTVNAEEARHAADQKVAEVTQATQQKEAEIQRKAAEETDRVAREGAKKVGEAEGVARGKEAEASEALWKARGQARDASSAKLVRLDKEILDLRPRLEKSLQSTDATATLANLRTKAAAVKSSIDDLDRSTVDNLEAAKKTIDARFDDLEQAISSAKKRA